MLRAGVSIAACCALAAVGCGGRAERLCGFDVRHAATEPTFLKPPRLSANTLVPKQPGSPVVVSQVDLNGTASILADAAPGGSYGVEVHNVSDRPISDIAVNVRLIAGQESASFSSRFAGQLAPDASIWIRGIGHFRPVADPPYELTIVAAVESLSVDGCVYSPTQIMPETLRGAPRAK